MADINFWFLDLPKSERLFGVSEGELRSQVTMGVCPVDPYHRRVKRTWQPLDVEVKHNKRDETMIWVGTPSRILVHESILNDLQKLGFSGHHPMPATIRFRDGSQSYEYSELVVTGWGGVAPEASGIRITQECPACGRKRYSATTDASQLIDRNQWSGDDFFIVWPLPRFVLITERVKHYLEAARTKSFSLKPQARFQPHPSGSVPGSLLSYMPEEFAAKHGRALGLE